MLSFYKSTSLILHPLVVHPHWLIWIAIISSRRAALEGGTDCLSVALSRGRRVDAHIADGICKGLRPTLTLVAAALQLNGTAFVDKLCGPVIEQSKYCRKALPEGVVNKVPKVGDFVYDFVSTNIY